MYLAIVLTTMLLAPLASIAENLASAGAGDLAATAAKWFVFWAIGIRLLLAGLRQIAQRCFTTQAIFNIADPATTKLVSEIGFANVALGRIASRLADPAELAGAGRDGRSDLPGSRWHPTRPKPPAKDQGDHRHGL